MSIIDDQNMAEPTRAGRADVVAKYRRSRNNGALMATLIIISGLVALVLMSRSQLMVALNSIVTFDLVGWLDATGWLPVLGAVVLLVFVAPIVVGIVASNRQAVGTQMHKTHRG